MLSIPILAALSAFTPAPQGGSWVDTLQFSGNATNERVGAGLAGLDDVDGDGVPDYAVGIPGRDHAGFLKDGVVDVRSGADHSLIRRIHNPLPQDGGGFGAMVIDFDDVDGDGVRELLASSSSDDPAHFSVVSGATGVVLASATYRAPVPTRFGSIARVDDVDGDGIADVLAGMPLYDLGKGGVLLFSGADGAQLGEVFNETSYEYSGSAVLGVEDYDGDGIGDWLVGAANEFMRDELGRKRYGTVRLISAATRSTLGLLSGDQNQAMFGASLARVGDLDGDGFDEIAVGQPDWDQRGAVEVHSLARAHSLLRRIEAAEEGGGFGTTLQATPDVDGDGHADLLVGQPRGANHGRVHLLSSWDGAPLLVHDARNDYDGDLGDSLGVVEAGPGQTGPTLLLGDPTALVRAPWSGIVHVLTHEALMTASAGELSVSAGGIVDFALAFPKNPSMRGAPYRILISGTGTGPVRQDAVTIPLTPDAYFWRSRTGDFARYQAGRFEGVLDGAARASARIVAEPGQFASLSGRTFWFAAVATDAAGIVQLSSVAVPLRLIP